MYLCTVIVLIYFFFFFQAEDGIRDKLVTGVQTCALPISVADSFSAGRLLSTICHTPERDSRTSTVTASGFALVIVTLYAAVMRCRAGRPRRGGGSCS